MQKKLRYCAVLCDSYMLSPQQTQTCGAESKAKKRANPCSDVKRVHFLCNSLSLFIHRRAMESAALCHTPGHEHDLRGGHALGHRLTAGTLRPGADCSGSQRGDRAVIQIQGGKKLQNK